MLAGAGRKIVNNSLKQTSSQQFLDTILCKQSPLRCLSNKTPLNTVLMFVPQQEAWVVERMGKFHRVLGAGLNILLPAVDRVKYVQCLKDIALEIPQRSAITSDNVILDIDGILFLKISDPFKASYGIEDPEFAVTQLAQTVMRSELGKLSLDDVLREKENLKEHVLTSLNKTCEEWGIVCLRYEIRTIQLPSGIQEAMKLQAEAERKSKAIILEAEGKRNAEITVAEGNRSSRIIESEAEQVEMLNRAKGEASALRALAEARAESIEIMARVLKNQAGSNAAALLVAQQYVSAFEKVAKTNNILVLPNNVGDISQAIMQALTIYGKVMDIPKQRTESETIHD